LLVAGLPPRRFGELACGSVLVAGCWLLVMGFRPSLQPVEKKEKAWGMGKKVNGDR
jgi:hypothetical protein